MKPESGQLPPYAHGACLQEGYGECFLNFNSSQVKLALFKLSRYINAITENLIFKPHRLNKQIIYRKKLLTKRAV
jgi:hypothetical protein